MQELVCDELLLQPCEHGVRLCKLCRVQRVQPLTAAGHASGSAITPRSAAEALFTTTTTDTTGGGPCVPAESEALWPRG